MIQVQIASQLTAVGVDGVRWVLVDSGEPGTTPAPAPGAATAAAAPVAGVSDDHHVPGPRVSLPLLKLTVAALGIVLAIWLARAVYGPARLPAWFPVDPPAPVRGAVPGRAAPPTPKPPASAVEPALTTSTARPAFTA